MCEVDAVGLEVSGETTVVASMFIISGGVCTASVVLPVFVSFSACFLFPHASVV